MGRPTNPCHRVRCHIRPRLLPTHESVYAVDGIRLSDGSHGRKPAVATVRQQPGRRRYYRCADGTRHEALGFLLECCGWNIAGGSVI